MVSTALEHLLFERFAKVSVNGLAIFKGHTSVSAWRQADGHTSGNREKI